MERRALQAKLEAALRAALNVIPPVATVELTLGYEKKSISQKHHGYELVTTLKNVGTKRIDDWELELQFPTPLLDGTIHAMKVEDRSDAVTSFFRVEGRKSKPLRPGEDLKVRIGYFVNEAIYDRRRELFAQTAKARALVDGTIAQDVVRTIDELQNF